MTSEEFIAARKAMGLNQLELGEKLGMSRRQVQNIEADSSNLRRVHALAMERLSLSHAVQTGDWQKAMPAIRQEAMDLVSLFRGKEKE